MSQPVVDPCTCTVRRVVLDPAGAIERLGRRWTVRPLAELAGPQGWQQAQLERRLSQEARATVKIANADGPDGVPHRDRLACAATGYRMGEEWLEVVRDHDVEHVGTIVEPTIAREISLGTVDAAALLAGTRSGDLDPWRHAPRDLIAHYSRIEQCTVERSFRPYTGDPGPGWVASGVYPDPDGAGLGNDIAGTGALYEAATLERTLDRPGRADCWMVDLIARVIGPDQAGTGTLSVAYGGVTATVSRSSAAAAKAQLRLEPGAGPAQTATLDATLPGVLALRLVAHHEWVQAWVGGVLVAMRRRRAPYTAPDRLTIASSRFRATVGQVVVLERVPALQPAGGYGDLALPGLPPAGGLQGQYYLEVDAWSQAAGSEIDWRRLILDPRSDPYERRVDATLGFAAASPPAWQPPGPYLGERFAATWTGAVWLDLAASDRRLQVACGAGDVVRVWVGRTMMGDEFLRVRHDDQTNLVTSSPLRATLGQTTGWYPIRVEWGHGTGAGGITLQDAPCDTAGSLTAAMATVPAERLSPYGIREDTVRRVSGREVIDQVTSDHGYQWAVEPRPIESSEWPGRLRIAARIGRDHDLDIDEAGSAEPSRSLPATDAIDRVLVDGSALASENGDSDRTVDVMRVGVLGRRLAVLAAYESGDAITEPSLLTQRAESLLAARSAPAEEVQLRPHGVRELRDSWPLTGDLALVLWRPGDGARLRRPDIGIDDRRPRQITQVSQTLYPGGAAAPQVAWRPRLRAAQQVLARTIRAVGVAQRTPSGALATVTGTLATGGASSTATMPPDPSRLVAAQLVVHTISGTWSLEVVGVATGRTIDRPGVYDITQHAPRIPTQISARLTGGSGTYALQLQILSAPG